MQKDKNKLLGADSAALSEVDDTEFKNLTQAAFTRLALDIRKLVKHAAVESRTPELLLLGVREQVLIAHAARFWLLPRRVLQRKLFFGVPVLWQLKQPSRCCLVSVKN